MFFLGVLVVIILISLRRVLDVFSFNITRRVKVKLCSLVFLNGHSDAVTDTLKKCTLKNKYTVKILCRIQTVHIH